MRTRVAVIRAASRARSAIRNILTAVDRVATRKPKARAWRADDRRVPAATIRARFRGAHVVIVAIGGRHAIRG